MESHRIEAPNYEIIDLIQSISKMKAEVAKNAFKISKQLIPKHKEPDLFDQLCNAVRDLIPSEAKLEATETRMEENVEVAGKPQANQTDEIKLEN